MRTTLVFGELLERRELLELLMEEFEFVRLEREGGVSVSEGTNMNPKRVGVVFVTLLMLRISTDAFASEISFFNEPPSFLFIFLLFLFL